MSARTKEQIAADLAGLEQILGLRPTATPTLALVPPVTVAVGSREKPGHFECGHVQVAANYVANHATCPEGVTLRRWRGGWYRWNSATGCYAEVSDEQLDREFYRTIGLGKRSDVNETRHALIAVGDVLIDDVELGGWIGPAPSSMDSRDVAACPNGLVHLPSGRVVPATPRYFATSALGVAYDPNAATPTRWLEFLGALWPDDPESIAALQEWFGYMLTGDTRQQKIMLLVGPKRSGKGTIMRVLTAMLGAASVAAPTLASLGSNFGLWPLIGRTAAIIGDARLDGRSDIAQIVERLLSISGQDPQTIDRKHRQPWTGYLSARISIVSNELPRFNDASGALASRMLALVLAQSWIGREDTGLTDALLEELPGILLWAMDGWRRLHERGHFVQPSSSAGTTDELSDLASPVSAWAREYTAEGGEVEVDTAYTAYRQWATRSGYPEKSKETFGRDLCAATGCKNRQVRIPGQERRPRCYVGIHLEGLVSRAVSGETVFLQNNSRGKES